MCSVNIHCNMLLKTVVRDEARVRVHAYGAIIRIGHGDATEKAAQPVFAKMRKGRVNFREAAAA